MTEGKQQEKTCVDLGDVIHAATCSYKTARCLSNFLLVVLFVVLIFIAIGLFSAVKYSFTHDAATGSLVFGGLGTVNIIVIVLLIEHIQSRADARIRSQIVCLSFTLQCNFIERMLESMHAADTDDCDTWLKVIQCLRDSTTQLIADLGRQAPVSSATEPDSEEEEA